NQSGTKFLSATADGDGGIGLMVGGGSVVGSHHHHQLIPNSLSMALIGKGVSRQSCSVEDIFAPSLVNRSGNFLFSSSFLRLFFLTLFLRPFLLRPLPFSLSPTYTKPDNYLFFND